jgi:DNA-binding MarR family transcriptional regulator
MAPMDSQDFARDFGALYRELYRLAVRRVDDGREVLSAETTALLLHLSQTGPQTLSELTQHLDRSLSTLSAKVSELESQGLLARQRDEQDARRALIWLSPQGRAALLEALEVLDAATLAGAASQIDARQRTQLLDGLRALVAALQNRRIP